MDRRGDSGVVAVSPGCAYCVASTTALEHARRRSWSLFQAAIADDVGQHFASDKPEEHSPLHCIIEYDAPLDVLKWALQRCVDLDCNAVGPGPRGLSPVALCMARGPPAALRLLLDAGGDPTQGGPGNTHPAVALVERNHGDAWDRLVLADSVALKNGCTSVFSPEFHVPVEQGGPRSPAPPLAGLDRLVVTDGAVAPGLQAGSMTQFALEVRDLDLVAQTGPRPGPRMTAPPSSLTLEGIAMRAGHAALAARILAVVSQGTGCPARCPGVGVAAV